ncbi:hypothetical protein AV530_012132 [Patagioenas fasciata monilis]|uniref:Uncharacterized protein n=1 Tax=Patagioenas fasciata monilis TaxID=372326 RepID=A0A1V4JV09_PATFA|nr:hypothetical protein AV530_012132 [Patagioenas fasciata monilis]
MSSLSGNPGQWKLRGRAKPFLWAPTSSDLSQLITQCPDSTGHTRNECTRVLLYRSSFCHCSPCSGVYSKAQKLLRTCTREEYVLCGNTRVVV